MRFKKGCATINRAAKSANNSRIIDAKTCSIDRIFRSFVFFLSLGVFRIISFGPWPCLRRNDSASQSFSAICTQTFFKSPWRPSPRKGRGFLVVSSIRRAIGVFVTAFSRIFKSRTHDIFKVAANYRMQRRHSCIDSRRIHFNLECFSH